MRHHGIVVSCYGFAAANERAHEKAVEIFGERAVSAVHSSAVNSYASFFIFPDGSKEGWRESNDGDAQRALFKQWMIANRICASWAEIQYGDDDGDNRVIDTDALHRVEEE